MTNPMTNPVAPVEGPLYLLFTEYENTTNIRKWSKEPFYGAQEYVPVGELERLRAALRDLTDCIDVDSCMGRTTYTVDCDLAFQLAAKAALAKMEESK